MRTKVAMREKRKSPLGPRALLAGKGGGVRLGKDKNTQSKMPARRERRRGTSRVEAAHLRKAGIVRAVGNATRCKFIQGLLFSPKSIEEGVRLSALPYLLVRKDCYECMQRVEEGQSEKEGWQLHSLQALQGQAIALPLTSSLHIQHTLCIPLSH